MVLLISSSRIGSNRRVGDVRHFARRCPRESFLLRSAKIAHSKMLSRTRCDERIIKMGGGEFPRPKLWKQFKCSRAQTGHKRSVVQSLITQIF